jgi:hypothetical protein
MLRIATFVALTSCSAAAVSSSGGGDAAAPDGAIPGALEAPSDASAPKEAAPPPAPEDAGSDAAPAPGCVAPPRSLANDVLPIVGARCSFDACHGANMTSSAAFRAFVLEVADECPDGRAIVSPGKPDQSYILDKLSNRNLCAGSPMPKPADGAAWVQIPSAELETISDWICNGAPDN